MKKSFRIQQRETKKTVWRKVFLYVQMPRGEFRTTLVNVQAVNCSRIHLPTWPLRNLLLLLTLKTTLTLNFSVTWAACKSNTEKLLGRKVSYLYSKLSILLAGPLPFLNKSFFFFCLFFFSLLGLPCGSAGKESTHTARDLGLIPGLERSPGKGKGYPL